MALENRRRSGPGAGEQFGLPLVLKADGSWGGAGVAIAHNARQAHADAAAFLASVAPEISATRRSSAVSRIRLVRAMMPVAPRPGAQRFVTGHPATSAIACWRGKLLAANHFDVTVASAERRHRPRHRGGAQRLAPPWTDSAATIVACFWPLRPVRPGLYARRRTGRVFLLEINPRATPTSHLALGVGHDLVAALLTRRGPAHPRPAGRAPTKPALPFSPRKWTAIRPVPHLTAGYHRRPAAGRSRA